MKFRALAITLGMHITGFMDDIGEGGGRIRIRTVLVMLDTL